MENPDTLSLHLIQVTVRSPIVLVLIHSPIGFFSSSRDSFVSQHIYSLCDSGYEADVFTHCRELSFEIGLLLTSKAAFGRGLKLRRQLRQSSWQQHEQEPVRQHKSVTPALSAVFCRAHGPTEQTATMSHHQPEQSSGFLFGSLCLLLRVDI